MSQTSQGPGGGSEYLTAEQAAERLGIKRATLYAYASRGRIRSLPGGHGPARRYLRADVEKLRARRESRRGPPSGSLLLAAGEPLLDSSITWLAAEGPVYRGRPALAMAREGLAFEAVAEWLWAGHDGQPEESPATVASRPDAGWDERSLGLPLDRVREWIPAGTPPLEALPVLVGALGVRDLGRHDLAPGAVLPRARRLIRRLAAGVALSLDAAGADEDASRIERSLEEARVAGVLARALGVEPDEAVRRALDQALVLLADHELNASAFATRVAASTHADLYACLCAGLATLSGPRHGGAVEQLLALVQTIPSPADAADAVRERMRLGERIPGFGHLVYDTVDPRAEPLLEVARSLDPGHTGVHIIDALIGTMRDLGRPFVNVDGALAALALVLDIPRRSAPALFVIARLAGLTAHALEQYGAGGPVLRPRARYRETGPR